MLTKIYPLNVDHCSKPMQVGHNRNNYIPDFLGDLTQMFLASYLFGFKKLFKT